MVTLFSSSSLGLALSTVLLSLASSPPRFANAFQPTHPPISAIFNRSSKPPEFKAVHGPRKTTHLRSSLPPTPSQEQTYDTVSPTHPLSSLISATTLACEPRRLDTTADAHEAFRYEWGTWCSEERLDGIMSVLRGIRLREGWQQLLDDGLATRWAVGADGDHGNGGSTEVDAVASLGVRDSGRRIRIAGDKYWDIILHLLPKNSRDTHKWPEGSWTILQPLTGLTQVAKLRGPNSEGFYTPISPRDIRGGGDGDAFASRNEAGYSTAGEACVKYLGGPLRGYTGKALKSTVLEIVVRPPITTTEKDREATGDIEVLDWDLAEKVFVRVENETVSVQAESTSSSEASVASKDLMDGTITETSIEGRKTPQPSVGLNKKLGMDFENVGGLDAQLDDIARRVLASRANPEAARRLGVSHVRGILLSGPPGCGKTLLARELSRLLGAREPQIVNGPEILDKFIGEAERRVRDLFAPAEREYDEVGDASALHLIILDEIDAIARKRGSMTSDTTGVRDSVVNQLLAKIDGVKEASNILVVGLTNRPELIDPALLRPGRLEVQLRVELPDRFGRRDILRIHTRKMKDGNALSSDAIDLIEDLDDNGLGAITEHFSGAELAGLVRSAASYALARAVESDGDGMVTAADLKKALGEDDILKLRLPFGISKFSSPTRRIIRDLNRFTAPVVSSSPQLHSLLLVGGGAGAGVTALAANAAVEASVAGNSDYVRFITALDVLTSESGGGDEARASALIERFSEAREMQHSLLVLDDIDQILGGNGKDGYSVIMVSTLRALLRIPPADVNKAGGHLKSRTGRKKTMHIIATSSRRDAACHVLDNIFEETIVVPLISDVDSVQTLLSETFTNVMDVETMSKMIIGQLKVVGSKTALRLVERALFTATYRDQQSPEEVKLSQLAALSDVLHDLSNDEATASKACSL